MKILIYGAGAVGLGIASCLLNSGEDIDIIAREDTVCALRKYGLVRRGIFGEYTADPRQFRSYTSLKALPPKIYDYILVCTKSFDSHTAAKDIATYDSLIYDERVKIILFQNGWGNAEIFCEFFPEDLIYNGRVITGFFRPKKNEVVITVHADAIHIGSLYHKDLSGMDALCNSITRGGIPCEVTLSIEGDLWAKMLYNCALNPLGAILAVPYGLLGAHNSTRIIMKGIVEEIFMIIKEAGYKTHWESADAYLKTFYERLLPPTAGHESSTLQDIQAKKKTEIDALNGAIIRLGEKFNFRTPFNLLVYNLVKFIEDRGCSSI